MTQQFTPRFAVAALLATLAQPLWAQDAPGAPAQGADSPAPAVAKTECPPPAALAEPATQQTATNDGTAPSNSGSTGWSGGTGGSMIGTNPSGATRHTKTWHAPTARGLDLKGRPEPASTC